MSKTHTLALSHPDHARRLFGPRDENLRLVADHHEVQIGARGEQITVTGPEKGVDAAVKLLTALERLVEAGFPLYGQDVAQAATLLGQDPEVDLNEIFFDGLLVTARGRTISPRTLGQKRYVDAIRKHDIVFGIGPAGTGKTYLAMAMAVAALTEHRVDRIILCRPAVEAGERLGFLPGDVAEKVNPYLRPLYDALNDMLEHERAKELLERGTVEVAPLAFMRGRTLNDAFVILDEAQNTTREQMKMFLTRLGFGAQAIITGDVTQIDLPNQRHSGLLDAERVLARVPGVAMCHFDPSDVVRHPLVQRVIEAYDRADQKKSSSRNRTRRTRKP